MKVGVKNSNNVMNTKYVATGHLLFFLTFWLYFVVVCVAGRQLPLQTLRGGDGQRGGVQPLAGEPLLSQGLHVPPHGDQGELRFGIHPLL